jgi:drug/metabolite transporter (DMT)-like permease
MIVLNLNPFWTGLLGLCINKEQIRLVDILAMIFCFTGVVSIALSKTENQEEK